MTDSQVKTWIQLNNTSWSFPTYTYYDDETDTDIEICTTLHDAIEQFKSAFALWIAGNLDRYQRMYDALQIEYEPLYNYDKSSKITETNSGTDTTTLGAKSGDTTDKLRGFNSSGDNIVTKSDSNTLAATDTLQHGHKIVTEEETHGNIGTTSTQDMLTQEIRVRNEARLYQWIMDDIVSTLLIL